METERIMKFKSVEKLRHHAHVLKGGSTDYNELFEIADEIEAEIAERFMELPVDTDGVPIKPGDIMQFRDDAPVRVDSIGNSKCYVGDFGWFGGNGGFYGKGTLKCCRHVKPRTLEDMLIEYRLKAYNLYADQELTGEERVNEFKKLDAEYDSDIRELLGVGE